LKNASGSFESVTEQKHREVALIDDAGRNPERIQSGVYRHDGNQTRKQDSTEPPDTWTVCPVVWEDGGGQPPPPTRFRPRSARIRRSAGIPACGFREHPCSRSRYPRTLTLGKDAQGTRTLGSVRYSAPLQRACFCRRLRNICPRETTRIFNSEPAGCRVSHAQHPAASQA
jgi:hypothetical protein